MTRVFHRSVHHTPPTVDRGEGCYLFDQQGNRYIDACSSVVVSCLGHNHPAVIEAIRKQSQNVSFAHTSFFTSESLERLAVKLNELAPDPLGYSCMVSGGSEAVESALKMARQYYVERGQTEKKYFISRNQSYHGYTMGALSIGGHEPRRKTYRPMLIPVHHIETCYPYRHKLDTETEEQYSLRAANELEKKLLEVGPENIMAFTAETIVGATAGVLVPTRGYLKRIREICTEYDILLILDEVMCGSGRSGTFFAFSQEDIVPDIVTISKALGGGYQPIGAAICSEEIYAAAQAGSGVLHGGHTFMGHTLATSAANAVLETIEKENLLENVRNQGAKLIDLLRDRLEDNPNVGDIRGRGLFVGIEFVADKETKEPLDESTNFHQVLKRATLRNGLLLYPADATIDGHRGHHILIAPPYIVDEAIVGDIVELLVQSIDESIRETKV